MMVAFEGRFYKPPIRWGGPWAWFRMIDATMDRVQDAQQQVQLRVQTPTGPQVRIAVGTVPSSMNPFESAAVQM